MRNHKPEYVKSYKHLVRFQLGRMKESYKEALEGIYGSKEWRESYIRTVQPNTDRVWIESGRHGEAGTVITSLNPHDILLTKVVINEEKLDRNAEAYAEAATLQWHTKMMEKLGDLDEVEVPHLNDGYILITGKRDGHTVRIEQQVIINWSTQGTPFNQWPARIYVDGKFTPEREYKKLIGIKTTDQPKTLNHCNSCGHTGRQGEFRDPRRSCLVCPKCRSVAVYRIPNPDYTV